MGTRTGKGRALDRFFPPRRSSPVPDLATLVAERKEATGAVPAGAVASLRSFKKSGDNSIALKEAHVQTLEADGFRNDYYSHLLDCRDENVLGIVLHNKPWLLNRREKLKLELTAVEGNGALLTSLSFCRGAKDVMALGTAAGAVQVFDLQKRATNTYQLHDGRVACLDWNPQATPVIASGAKDRTVCVSDMRLPEAGLLRLSGHVGEICGLRWSGNGRELASGGNDNLVCVWDVRSPAAPRTTITSHRAAVRGIAWAPFREGLLATGGGSGDMRVLVHNTQKGELVKEFVSDSQICALAWDERSRALVSGHGLSRYQICLWDLEARDSVYELLGHTHRVLGLCLAGGTLFSASADETVRVWELGRHLLRGERPGGIVPFGMR